MIRFLLLATAVLPLACSSGSARSELPAGNYIVYYSPDPSADRGLFLLKVSRKGGADVAEVLQPPQNATVESFKVENRKVHIVFKAFGGRTLSFEGTIDPKDDKVILGSFGDDKSVMRARLAPTDKNAFTDDTRVVTAKLPPPTTKAYELMNAVGELRTQLRRSGDDKERRAALQQKLAAAQEKVQEQVPGLFRETLEKHADSPAAADALVTMLRANEEKLKPDEVVGWLKAIDEVAARYGPRYRLDVLGDLAEKLNEREGFNTAALAAAELAGAAVTVGSTPGQQVRAFKALKSARERVGKADGAKELDARIAALEEALDREYLEKVPPFKPAKFQGRKQKSDRVVAVELFTGAECPPCVAADVAFDALLKAYRPTDVVMLQYHMHIPGPDPLTSPASIARWAYYEKVFPDAIRGTPTILFNGKPYDGSGGGMDDAEERFTEYRTAIDPLLDEPTAIKLEGTVDRKGDELTVRVDGTGFKDPGERTRLRLFLVEEAVRYPGGNGIRFHHHVVRDMPGGVEGFPVNGAKAEAAVKVNLATVRSNLTKYLESAAKEEGPFADRPLALKNMRIIAVVQNDANARVLQALQLDVPELK